MFHVTPPEKVGMSSERLAHINPVIEEFVKDNRLPGVMTLVQRKGHIVHFGKFGMMDIEAGKPMQEDTIFRIFSMTKAVTSVAIMMLYEEGRLSLKDAVSKYIPAFAKTKVYDGLGVTGMKMVEQDPPMSVYNLLTHTSGLSYGSFFNHPVEEQYRQIMGPMLKRENTLQSLIECLAELPLLFQPGTRWHYGSSTDVLGYVVQVISGMPFEDFLSERIFNPLGMVDTGFHVPAGKINRLAQLYGSPALFDPVPVPPDDTLFIGDVTRPTRSPSGGAGLVSTLNDYFQFCKCLLNNGAYDGGRLINRKTLAWMTANHIPEVQMPMKHGNEYFDFGFGLGFRVATHLGRARQLTSVGEYGWDGAARTHFWIDPAEDMLGLLMTQLLPAQKYPVTERFQAITYASIVD